MGGDDREPSVLETEISGNRGAGSEILWASKSLSLGIWIQWIRIRKPTASEVELGTPHGQTGSQAIGRLHRNGPGPSGGEAVWCEYFTELVEMMLTVTWD